MDNIKTTALYKNIQIGIIEQLGEGCLTDMVLGVVMPMFEPFIEERLSNFKLYREAAEKANHPIIITNWKPSEEQIYSLGTVVNGMGESAFGVSKNLRELYEQLKKLM